MLGKLPVRIMEFLGNDIKSHMFMYAKGFELESVKESLSQTLDDFLIPYYNKNRLVVKKDLILDYMLQPFNGIKRYNYDEKDVIFELYISPKGMVASYNDENYHSGMSIESFKFLMENRMPPPFVKGVDVDSAFVYGFSDIISVDENTGTMFMGIELKKAVEALTV